MSSPCEKFLKPDDFSSLDTTTYININVIKLKPLEFSSNHEAGKINGLEEIRVRGKLIEEVAYINDDLLDQPENINHFIVKPDNSIYFIVSKENIKNSDDAKSYIWGMYISYQMRDIKYVSDDESIYTIETRKSDGTLVKKTVGTTLQNLINVITILDKDQDLKNEGYYIHSIRRNIK